MNDLLSSYRQDRWQFVSATKISLLARVKIETGVPQASILRPFLFLRYVNDLHLVIENNKIVVSADNTTIVNSGKISDPLVGKDLRKRTDWFHCNKLTVNVKKCEAISFGAYKFSQISSFDKLVP